jgi:hypothetical protein
MSWQDKIKKGHIAGNTEWYTEVGDKVKEFASERQALYRMKKLNAELSLDAPKWELYNTFKKPMLRRQLK